ncbi:MAG: hypothetical protein HGA42_11080 [Nostocales cyanobacterium W4_Combined_metabat2_030]|nr:hypothetical protein [Nostocales cyanobacterium W4_Combined_metabat2_030]
MTKDEKAAFYKIMMEGMLLTLSTIAITMLFSVIILADFVHNFIKSNI